ncbi:glycosyltransferase [Verticiella sediminum]|uniref:Glycosyltransferase n=1 Tax=Verticiella sediminum TaxID=1247510 RepID=A0A556AYZ4_9BURK|nr:glycosyltransferase [Verticiella sediminum]TSH98157.1 glycosyltransferase [Verticiella sediminum]
MIGGSGADGRSDEAGTAATAGAPRRRLLFHIRQFGVGGIENALMGWLRTIDRSRFEVGLAVSLPTREFVEIYRPCLPPDVRTHVLLPAGRVSALMQRRRDHRLGMLGRAGLGVAMSTWAQWRVRAGLRDLVQGYDVLVDFDLTLRKVAGRLPIPMVGVRHFGFWRTRSSKAIRVGRDLARYDAVAVLNATMCAQARTLYGDTVRLALLPNVFDFSAMRAAGAAGVAGLPSEDYVVCVARLDMATKGQDVLLQAWADLCAEPGWREHLVLVGDGPDLGRARELAARLGLAERVSFTGLQTQPYPWIARARVLVLASRAEGQPNVLIEAMALGCVAISTDCPVGPRDLLDGGAGLLVPPDDPAALAAAIRRALRDPQTAAACRERAAAAVLVYDAPAGNARLAALVEEVIRARGGG